MKSFTRCSLGDIKFEDNEYIQQHVLQFLRDANKDFCATGFSRVVDAGDSVLNCRETMLRSNTSLSIV